MGAEDTVTDLASVVPVAVRQICERLRDGGHEAWCVGGAVRDALLGRVPGDWDVTTSALPDAVQEIFERTIPTGIEHGTVTVLEGKGDDRRPVEVTTFRGEHGYSDARRPDQVTFGVSLREDLARRDFVINAIAYDPIAGELFDPFGGAADIEARTIRAVGDALQRFTEDGLRTMRAVRFVAALDFELDPATEAAIPVALSSLRKVALERIRVELEKLLRGTAAVRGLEVAHRTGALLVALPESGAIAWDSAVARIAAAPRDATLRMAAMLCELHPDAVDAAARRLTFSNADRQRMVRGCRALAGLESLAADEVAVRRFLAAIGRAGGDDCLALWDAELERLGGDERRGEVRRLAEAILARGDALAIGDLAVSGADLLAAGVEKGPAMGETLRDLLDRALEDPAVNTRDRLLALVGDR